MFSPALQKLNLSRFQFVPLSESKNLATLLENLTPDTLLTVVHDCKKIVDIYVDQSVGKNEAHFVVRPAGLLERGRVFPSDEPVVIASKESAAIFIDPQRSGGRYKCGVTLTILGIQIKLPPIAPSDDPRSLGNQTILRPPPPSD